nr:hypothetical protein [Paraflavitalea sp. H1-2-19X]
MYVSKDPEAIVVVALLPSNIAAVDTPHLFALPGWKKVEARSRFATPGYCEDCTASFIPRLNDISLVQLYLHVDFVLSSADVALYSDVLADRLSINLVSTAGKLMVAGARFPAFS